MDTLTADFFNEDYFVRGAELGISAYDERAFDLSNDVFIKQADMLTDILKLGGKRVIEVGCATGNLVYYLRKLGVNALGEDISVWAWENSYVPPYHHIGDVQNGLYSHNATAVISFHTMEHLPHPDKALRQIYKALIPGGIFFSVIPSDGHEHDPSGVSMLTRDEWHKLLTDEKFVERKDLYDKFFWHELIKKWNWEVYCYERG